MPREFLIDANATGIFKVDWSQWLPTGATISSGTFIMPAGLRKKASALADSNTSMTITVAGGTVGEVYSVVNRVIVSDGQKEDRTIAFTVTQK